MPGRPRLQESAQLPAAQPPPPGPCPGRSGKACRLPLHGKDTAPVLLWGRTCEGL